MNNQATSSLKPDFLVDSDALAVLIFTVGSQSYSLPVTYVVRIIEMVTITPLFEGPAMIQGLINLQGAATPVIDLRRHFGCSTPVYGANTPIIVVDAGGGGQKLGLIVDAVEDVLHISQASLELIETFLPPEAAGQGSPQTAYLSGVIKIEQRIIPLVDARALLTVTEQRVLAETLYKDAHISVAAD